MGLSGFADVAAAGALAAELLVPACKSNCISKTVIICHEIHFFLETNIQQGNPRPEEAIGPKCIREELFGTKLC